MLESGLSAASAMPLSCVMSRLYVPSCAAETFTRYWLPEPVRAVTGLSAPPWSIVSVQLSRVPVSPPALSLTRKIQSPAIPVPSKSGVYVWSMSFAEPPARLCSV